MACYRSAYTPIVQEFSKTKSMLPVMAASMAFIDKPHTLKSTVLSVLWKVPHLEEILYESKSYAVIFWCKIHRVLIMLYH